MLLRRKVKEATAPTSVDEALALADELRNRADGLGNTPGLLDGALEEMHSSLERTLREHHRVTRGNVAALMRDLEPIGKRVKELRDEGRLSPRHAKLVSQALQHVRRVHYWNARKTIDKLAKGLEPLRSWRRDLDTYTAFYRQAADRVRNAEADLERLRAVPKPQEGLDEVEGLRAIVEACNRAADIAWSHQTSKPAIDTLEEIVAHPDIEGLGLLSTLEFACLRELNDTFEAHESLKEEMGGRSLAELVSTSEYSVGKWDRVFPNAMHERKRLQELYTQLRPVVSGRYGASFQARAPVQGLERRVTAWRRFPGGNAEPMRRLVELLVSGRVPAIQEAAAMYEEHGELAIRAWDGRLEEDIAAKEEELAEAREVLKALPDPSALAE